MKKVMLMMAATLMSTALVFAQTSNTNYDSQKKSSQSTTNVRETFYLLYPDATMVRWQYNKDDGSSRVTYADPGNVNHSILYDKKGKMISQRTQYSAIDVPLSITTYFSSRTEPGDTYDVWKEVDNNGNTISYVSDYKGKITYFNSEGKVTTHEPSDDDDSWKVDYKIPVDK